MRLSLIFFTQRGGELAKGLAQGLEELGHDCALSGPERFAPAVGAEAYKSLACWTAEAFSRRDGLIFVSACGIAVRAVAPYVKDKLTDPAVVSVDEAGRFAVPLLSGHVGGANDLARTVAVLTGGTAVISTATDVNGRFAVDQWAREQGMVFQDRSLAKKISAALLEGKSVGMASDYPVEGELPRGVTLTSCDLGFYITARTDNENPFTQTMRLWPKVLHLGIGCRKDVSEEKVFAAVDGVLREHHLSPLSVRDVSSIDLKKDEAALHSLSRQRGWPLTFYRAEELRAVEGEFTPSRFVSQITGVDNVCERAAVKRSGGRIIVHKTALDGVTVAVAEEEFTVRFIPRSR